VPCSPKVNPKLILLYANLPGVGMEKESVKPLLDMAVLLINKLV
jgi:hypothetical protein